jgi:Type I phosphodiesterase / nucleotide pyrophosphatase
MMRIFVVRFVILVCASLTAPQVSFAQQRTEHVVLVTLDGARYQEMFGGLDRELLQSTAEKVPVESRPSYKKYWAATPEERRKKLLPFFWGTLMAEGSIAGNQGAGSVARVTNTHRFSYPGYAEILTGEAHDAVIKSNDPAQNPFETVLEFVRRKLGLPADKVAAFASWGVFSGIVEHVPGTITSNAGVQRWESSDPLIQQLNELQFEAAAPWDLIRLDAFTFRLSMAYLKTHKPRLMYLALDETDDWAHDGKYELVLDSYARTDAYLKELWEFLQSDPEYRGTTTLIITTDHGRGRTIADWRSHGKDIEGAQDIWVAVVSPHSQLRGEWRNAAPVFQNQIAATIARLFGLDLSELRPTAGRPILSVWGTPAAAASAPPR